MTIKKVLYVEDSTSKFMDIYTFLKKQGLSVIDRVTNAEDAVKTIKEAEDNGVPYDLLFSDMHFDFFGEDDREAGEKLVALLREKGYSIPVVFCSSQNWNITDGLGMIHYNPYRNWEAEAEELLRKIRQL